MAEPSISLHRNNSRTFEKEGVQRQKRLAHFRPFCIKKTYKQRQACLALNMDIRKKVDIKTKIHINTSPGIFCKILSTITFAIFLTIRVSLSLV
jgi:hypothetical protein